MSIRRRGRTAQESTTTPELKTSGVFTGNTASYPIAVPANLETLEPLSMVIQCGDAEGEKLYAATYNGEITKGYKGPKAAINAGVRLAIKSLDLDVKPVDYFVDGGEGSALAQLRAQMEAENPRAVKGDNSSAAEATFDYWDEQSNGEMTKLREAGAEAALEISEFDNTLHRVAADRFTVEVKLARCVAGIAGHIKSSRARGKVYDSMKQTLAQQNTPASLALLSVFEGSKNRVSELTRLGSMPENVLNVRPESLTSAGKVTEWYAKQHTELANWVLLTLDSYTQDLEGLNACVHDAFGELTEAYDAKTGLEGTLPEDDVAAWLQIYSNHRALEEMATLITSEADFFNEDESGKFVVRQTGKGAIVPAVSASGRGENVNELLAAIAKCANEKFSAWEKAREDERAAAEAAEAEAEEAEENRINNLRTEWAELDADARAAWVMRHVFSLCSLSVDDEIAGEEVAEVIERLGDALEHAVDNRMTYLQASAALIGGDVPHYEEAA